MSAGSFLKSYITANSCSVQGSDNPSDLYEYVGFPFVSSFLHGADFFWRSCSCFAAELQGVSLNCWPRIQQM